MGNKGGVGISLNIDGTTFLLINAHLAGWIFVDVSKSMLTIIIYNSSRRQGASSTGKSDQDQGGVMYSQWGYSIHDTLNDRQSYRLTIIWRLMTHGSWPKVSCNFLYSESC